MFKNNSANLKELTKKNVLNYFAVLHNANNKVISNLVDEKILRLEITMKNIAAVTKSQTSQQLKHKGLKTKREIQNNQENCFQKNTGAMSELKTSLAFMLNNLTGFATSLEEVKHHFYAQSEVLITLPKRIAHLDNSCINFSLTAVKVFF